MGQALSLIVVALLPSIMFCQGQRPSSEPQPERSVEQQLITLDNALENAVKNGDSAFFEKVLAADYLGIGANGHTSTKAGTVKFVRSGKLKWDGLDVTDRQVRVYGSTAVITKQEHYLNAHSGDQDISGTYRTTSIFVKQEDGDWQEVGWQSTQVIEPQPK